MSGFQATIGIETHVQLKTKTKLFAAVSNDSRDASPNTLVSHICLGMPGALPVLNKAAVELSCRAAFALGVRPQSYSMFDRKHYFYPDLPKGYQISQFSDPLIIGGFVEINIDGQKKKIGVTRAHLEEDAGKTTHPKGKDYSLVDLNRAGTPLLEIVSEPDIKSAAEAKAYAQALYLLMKYADVSDVDLYHGNMRFDVNVSVSKDPNSMGTRTETKNLNSFKAVEKTVEYEIKRQTELLQKGGKVVQETRGWDEAKQKTLPQRGKEESHDYRYFPDPDIPPLELSADFIDKIKKDFDKRNFATIKDQLASIGHLSDKDLKTLFNNPGSVDLALSLIASANNQAVMPKLLDWLIHVVPSLIDDTSALNQDEQKIAGLIRLAEATAEGSLVSTTAKTGLEKILNEENFDVDEFISQNKSLSDEAEIEGIVSDVLAENAAAADDVARGEMKAIGFLVGQVMQKSKGRANPQTAQRLIKKLLGV